MWRSLSAPGTQVFVIKVLLPCTNVKYFPYLGHTIDHVALVGDNKQQRRPPRCITRHMDLDHQNIQMDKWIHTAVKPEIRTFDASKKRFENIKLHNIMPASMGSAYQKIPQDTYISARQKASGSGKLTTSQPALVSTSTSHVW